MKTTITKHQFVDEMIKHSFSYEGSKVLFEYLEEIEDPNIEFDPISIRCEYSEYENFAEIQENYRSLDINSIAELREYTTVLEIPDNDRLIILDF
tara:strand:- start:34 stop:318 length:285 start_codon:yes stop_codon:yes gene_type:complete